MTSADWIQLLQLTPHPEGGFYRQTYRADLMLDHLPGEFSGVRAASTAIYFLLAGNDFSALHRLRSDEVWHFYAGSALSVEIVSPDGKYSNQLVGSNARAGESFQAVVKAGCWFGSRLIQPDSFALVGCTVAPGFEFADFELARRNELISIYPQHGDLITRLTRA